MVLLYLLIVIISLIFSFYFFKKSAGTLHLGKLNLISITFYLFLAQVFAGAALVMLGFNQHYSLKKLLSPEDSITIMFYVVMVSAVLWPACMLLFLRIFRVKPQIDYIEYLKKPTLVSDNKLTFKLVLILGVICLGLLTLYLNKIGFIPLLKLIQHPKGFSFSTGRIIINKTYIFGVYVRNIFILLAIPVLSYISFTFALTTRSKKWIALATIFFLASIITKTYNFEKAPVIFHFMVYVLIFIYYKGGIKTKWMIPIFGFGVVLLLGAYALIGGGIDISLYNGIGGRLLFSQVGGLTYNFDLFPHIFPFLEGRSISTTLVKFFGIDSGIYIRSARLIMEFYSPEGVYQGVAGVINSFFVGEAFANFGWGGVVFSVFWTAFVISGVFALTIKIRKTPITITLAAYFSIFMATTINGGFNDFIYNITWIVVLGGLLLLEYIPDIMKRVVRNNRIPQK